MDEPLENLYFNWLCAKVIRLENPTPSLRYDTLLRILHNTEFVWLLDGDDNRAEDALELRVEFLLQADIPDNPEWRDLAPSVFETMISLSRRAEFMTDINAKDWFWQFIHNLGLSGINDARNLDSLKVTVDEILDDFVWRKYEPTGHGGMFPLSRTNTDQTRTELWYQLCEYIEELETPV